MNRDKKIIKISIIGIIVNILLVIFKSLVGLATNSIAIILDAINNLSDVLSSVITIIGTKLSNRRPDKEHPFGHGRAEYFAAIIIVMIIFIAGAIAFRESIEKIINPIEITHSIITLIIIAIAVLVKYILGIYVGGEGEKLESTSLIASGADAISDSLLSLSILIGALINYLFGFNIEGYLGLFIALMIIRSALKILGETANEILGGRADPRLSRKLKNTIMRYEEVQDVYDLIIHSYGPSKLVASAHIQIDDSYTVKDVDRLTRKIEDDIYQRYEILLTIGVYASNTEGTYKRLKEDIAKTLNKYKTVIDMHGLYVDGDLDTVSFDITFDFTELDTNSIVNEIKKELESLYSNYKFHIAVDSDLVD